LEYWRGIVGIISCLFLFSSKLGRKVLFLIEAEKLIDGVTVYNSKNKQSQHG